MKPRWFIHAIVCDWHFYLFQPFRVRFFDRHVHSFFTVHRFGRNPTGNAMKKRPSMIGDSNVRGVFSFVSCAEIFRWWLREDCMRRGGRSRGRGSSGRGRRGRGRRGRGFFRRFVFCFLVFFLGFFGLIEFFFFLEVQFASLRTNFGFVKQKSVRRKLQVQFFAHGTIVGRLVPTQHG